MSNFFKHRIALAALLMSVAVAPSLASQMAEDESNLLKREALTSCEQPPKRLKIYSSDKKEIPLTDAQRNLFQKLVTYEKGMKNLLGIFYHGLGCDSPILESLHHILFLTTDEAIIFLREIQTLRLGNGGQDIQIDGIDPDKATALNAIAQYPFNKTNGDLNNFFQLHGKSLKVLPRILGSLTHLTQIYLDNNQLRSLPDSLGQLMNLRNLNLHNNQLTSLPASLGQLTNLEILDLHNNQLTSLPDSLGQLMNLRNLNLYYNKLISLPASIGQLTNLSQLNLSNNQLTSLPDSLGQLTNLTWLNLSNIKLTVLPNFLGQLTNLRELYLYDNNLTVLPNYFGRLTNLTYLSLSNNQLTEIPASLGQLTGLQRLYLAKNPVVDSHEKQVNLLKRFSRNVWVYLKDQYVRVNGTKED